MGIAKWFKPVSLQGWAFVFQRITGVILFIYLCMHLTYLSSLGNPQLYERLISTTVSPEFLPFDILLVLVGVYHGVNGMRIIAHEFGFLHEHRRILLVIAAVVSLIAWAYASYLMARAVM